MEKSVHQLIRKIQILFTDKAMVELLLSLNRFEQRPLLPFFAVFLHQNCVLYYSYFLVFDGDIIENSTQSILNCYFSHTNEVIRAAIIHHPF